MSTTTEQKTRGEVEDLKAQWLADPCWDIETTEGYEAHAEELRAFRAGKEAEWRAAHYQRMLTKSNQMGCAGNVALAEYIFRLEMRLDALESKANADAGL